MSEPITREETYLAALTGEHVNLPDPIIRTEMYLACLNGMEVNVPAPITRKEYFLYTLCRQGTGGGSVTINNQDKTITENGEYTADEGYTGLGTVTVNVEASGGGDDIARAIVERTITEYIDSGITSVGWAAFRECKALANVSIPNAASISHDAFANCNGLSIFAAPNAESIGERCFQGNTSLKSVRMPKLKGISASAFEKSGIETITADDFPAVTSLGATAFNGCTGLTEVDFPAMTNFSNSIFNGCSNLVRACLGMVSWLGSGNFSKCTALKTLVLRLDKVVTLPNVNNFTDTPFAAGGTGGTVYVPAALIESYKTATNWAILYTAGTCNFVAIEGSEYE